MRVRRDITLAKSRPSFFVVMANESRSLESFIYCKMIFEKEKQIQIKFYQKSKIGHKTRQNEQH